MNENVKSKAIDTNNKKIGALNTSSIKILTKLFSFSF